MRILLSNDDGVHSLGLRILAKELMKLGEVWVAAPLEEKSTTGHSLTLHKPLRVLAMKDYGPRFFGVSGSPADCVYLGVRQIMKARPDLVVSGINRGANLGQDVYYSGTVSAAREACMMGYPSLAVSLAVDFARRKPEEKLNYLSAARVAVEVLREVRKKGIELPCGTLFNLNVPDVPRGRVKGVRVASQGFRHYDGKVLKRRDHRGRDYFWVGGTYQGFQNRAGTDCLAVHEGYAALTPLKLDTTDLAFLAGLEKGLG